MNQQTFIRNIRSALGRSGEVHPRTAGLCTSPLTAQQRELLDRIRNRSQAQRLRLLERLEEMAAAINLSIIPVENAARAAAVIAEIADSKQPEWGEQKCIAAWKHPLIDRLQLADALAGRQVPVYVIDSDEGRLEALSAEEAAQQLRGRVEQSFIGVTAADYCLAATATLVMRTRPGQARSVSLVPAIHIGIIHIDQILADLKELYALLLWDPEVRREGLTNCMTFISGPSKTADIEAIMVHGAHGPREVHILVMLE